MAIIFNPQGLGGPERPAVEVVDPETGKKQGEGGSLDEALKNSGRDSEYGKEVVEELASLLPEDDVGLPRQEDVDVFIDQALKKVGEHPEGGGNIEISKEGIRGWAKFVGEIMRDKEVTLPVRLAGAAFLWVAFAFEMMNSLANKLDERLTAKQIVERYRDRETEEASAKYTEETVASE